MEAACFPCEAGVKTHHVVPANICIARTRGLSKGAGASHPASFQKCNVECIDKGERMGSYNSRQCNCHQYEVSKKDPKVKQRVVGRTRSRLQECLVMNPLGAMFPASNSIATKSFCAVSAFVYAQEKSQRRFEASMLGQAEGSRHGIKDQTCLNHDERTEFVISESRILSFI